MNVKNSWKRVVAGMLAVLVMAATVPAGTDFGGYFGGTDIVASADTSEQSETIATNLGENTYTGTNVTISAQDEGDPDGMVLSSTKSATISVADGYIITKAEFTNGYRDFPIERFSSAAGNVTYSSEVATVSDVNAQSLTVNGKDLLQIKQVKVYYEPVSAEKTETIATNTGIDGKESTFTGTNVTITADEGGDRDGMLLGSGIAIVSASDGYIITKVELTKGSGIINDLRSGAGNVTYSGDVATVSDVNAQKLVVSAMHDVQIKQVKVYYTEVTDVAVTGVELDKTTATIPYGGTETLTATVAPDGATDKTVTWSSSDTTVATVDENGVVTAVALGTATITATATNGTAEDTTDDFSATCAVTVEKADPTVKTAPAAVADLTYNGEPQDLITAGTSEDGTVQYAVVETDDDGDTSDYTIVKRDSADPLDLADVEVNTIYTPDLEGGSDGQAGVFFSSGNFIIDDITYTGIRLKYNPGTGKYYLTTNKGTLPITEGFDGLLVTDIDSGNVYIELVNTANPSGEVVIDEEAWVESIPNETDAGEYNVYYRVKGDNNHNDSKPTKIDGVKIAKADPTVTAPQPCDLTYSGEAQALITAGTSEDGTLVYAVGNNGKTAPTTYYDTLPTKTDAGTYYVWYKVIGDDNHNNSKAACVTAEIKKADATVTGVPQPCDLTYSGADQALITEGTATGGTMQYALSASPETQPKGEYSETVPSGKNAGNYYVWYKVKGDENHNDAAPACVTATIKKADSSPTAKDLTYNGQAQELVKAGQSPAIKVVYALGEDGQTAPTEGYSETIPTATNAGTHYVWYKVVGDLNYNDMTPVCLPVTIKKAAATVTANNITKYCGRADPELTYTAEGLLEGDTLTGALAREAGETAGKYKITQGTLTNENYNITFTGAEFTIEATQVNRLAGENRFATAVEISKAGFEKAENVILTSGVNYADGIAGVPLAARLGAPILLTAADKLSDATLAEIERLGAKNVYILGGEGVISADIEKALQEKKLQTWRIAGDNRYATAAAIAQRVSEDPTDVFFVYGGGFADTLSVSAIAARRNAPIVYLSTDGELDPSIAQYLAVLKAKGCVKNAYVIGGTGVISDDMMNKATAALGLESATRIAGNDRYATSAAVNKAFVDNFDSDELCAATGTDFADAVTGGVFAAAKKAPFILVSSKLNEDQIAFINSRSPMKINVFGGTGAVSDETVKAVIDAIVTAPNAVTQNITTQSE